MKHRAFTFVDVLAASAVILTTSTLVYPLLPDGKAGKPGLAVNREARMITSLYQGDYDLAPNKDSWTADKVTGYSSHPVTDPTKMAACDVKRLSPVDSPAGAFLTDLCHHWTDVCTDGTITRIGPAPIPKRCALSRPNGEICCKHSIATYLCDRTEWGLPNYYYEMDDYTIALVTYPAPCESLSTCPLYP